MRIALLANGTRGDTQPLLVLGNELSRRGHQVVLGVSPNLVDFGERTGLATYPLGPDSQQFFDSPDGQRWLAAGDARALTQALGKIVHDNAALLDADTLRVCEAADLIVTGSLSEHRGACVAESRGIPLACLHYAPMRPTGAYPNMLISTERLPRRRNLATHSLFQRMYWRSMAQDINKFRADLGLAPASTSTAMRLAAAGTLELQAYSSALVPDLVDYPTNRPIIGFLRPDRELQQRLGQSAVDPDLEAWLADGEPPVFVGFGSMPVIDTAAMLDMITNATDELGARVLIGAGWSRLGQDQVSGDRARIATGVLNYDQLLPRCRVAVHHGGSGTVAASVAAGIPTFVCSLVADNPFWGARIEQLGIGVHERFAGLDQDKLAAGLRRAFQPQVSARAREIGAAVRTEAGAIDCAADLVESKLPASRQV